MQEISQIKHQQNQKDFIARNLVSPLKHPTTKKQNILRLERDGSTINVFSGLIRTRSSGSISVAIFQNSSNCKSFQEAVKSLDLQGTVVCLHTIEPRQSSNDNPFIEQIKCRNKLQIHVGWGDACASLAVSDYTTVFIDCYSNPNFFPPDGTRHMHQNMSTAIRLHEVLSNILKLSRFVLMGHSYGAELSLLFAIKYPPLVQIDR